MSSLFACDSRNTLNYLFIYYRKVNDGNFGWRALRLLARRSPHFFVHGNYPINKLPEYLETMIKKIAKDRPVSSNFITISCYHSFVA